MDALRDIQGRHLLNRWLFDRFVCTVGDINGFSKRFQIVIRIYDTVCIDSKFVIALRKHKKLNFCKVYNFKKIIKLGIIH